MMNLKWFFALAVTSLSAAPSLYAMCSGGTPNFNKKSEAYVQDIFDASDLIGVFEVISIGPKKQGEWAGEFDVALKLRPSHLIKGEATNPYPYKYTGFNNGLPLPFLKGKKYLFAFSVRRGKFDEERCGRDFEIAVADADGQFYYDKFEALGQLQKSLRINPKFFVPKISEGVEWKSSYNKGLTVDLPWDPGVDNEFSWFDAGDWVHLNFPNGCHDNCKWMAVIKVSPTEANLNDSEYQIKIKTRFSVPAQFKFSEPNKKRIQYSGWVLCPTGWPVQIEFTDLRGKSPGGIGLPSELKNLANGVHCPPIERKKRKKQENEG